MTKESEEISNSSPEPDQHITPQKLQKALGKALVQVTVLNEHEKYTFNSGEPGVLASKPDAPQSHPSFLQNETIPTTSHHQTKQKSPTHIIETSNNSSTLFDRNNQQASIQGARFGNVTSTSQYSLFQTTTDSQLLQCILLARQKYGMKRYLTWHEFTADLCHCFCDKNQLDIIEEFNKLSQLNTVEEYQEKFEELKPLMLQQNCHLPESYFISSFISGLREEIKHKVKVHEPTTLVDAYRKAKLYELSMEIETKKFKTPFHTTPTTNKTTAYQHPLPQKLLQTTALKPSLLKYRRNNNLCFKCGDNFQPGHQCKQRQLNLMEEESTLEEDTLNQETEEEQEEGTLEISMNAHTGSVGYSTIRIQGTIKGKPLSILVDSGNTHSFITSGWAKEGLELQQTNPLIITVANGEKLQSNEKARQLQWKMQGRDFFHDFRVLQMGGMDMVLGVDWMRTFSPILMDFKQITLSFNKDGKEITLQGGNKQAYFKLISGEKTTKSCSQRT
ncbi:hypothetical protein GQ457_07G001740 [Hibiscus cannabinus]